MIRGIRRGAGVIGAPGVIGDRTGATWGACLLTVAGGSMDAWVYLAHGHLFANAQSGNVVLLALDASAGRWRTAAHILPSIVAFVAGLFCSRIAGVRLKRRGHNSRTARLVAEVVILLLLAPFARFLPQDLVTACVGFIAAVQITSLSHIGPANFNTGMTTGNLRGAASATVAAWVDPKAGDGTKATMLWLMCLAFLVGAALGGVLTRTIGDLEVFVIAGLVTAGIAVMRHAPDPLASMD